MSSYTRFGGWTDIRATSPVEEDVFVFAPVKKILRLKPWRTPGAEDFTDFFQSVMNLELFHVGTLNFRHDPRHGTNLWWEYSKCGHEPLMFKSHGRDDILDKWGAQRYIVCRQCGLHLGTRLNEKDFSRLVFYLMIKSAIPEMNICNSVNISYSGNYLLSFSRENYDLLKTGKPNPDKYTKVPPAQFRPGFVHASDKDYCNFFSESDVWIKLLFTEYMKHSSGIIQRISRDLGGPRRK